MSGSVWRAYRDEVLTNLGRLAYTFQTVPKTLSTWTEYVPLSPRSGDTQVLGVFAEFVQTLTNATTNVTVTALTVITVGSGNTPTDVLDLGFDQVQVAPSAATQARSYSQSRLFQEEVERVLLDCPKLSYPRQTYVSAVGSAMTPGLTTTVTGSIFIPVGGNAGAVRFHIPPVTNVYTTTVTASVVVNCYVVSGNTPTLATFLENPVGSLGGGQQDLSLYYPANISPDWIFALNETSASITRFYETTQGGDILLDIQDQTALNAAQNGIAPEVTSVGYNSMVFAQDEKRFKTIQMSFTAANARQFGFLELLGTQVTNPPPPTASTPAVPASQTPGTGNVGAGGYPAPAGHPGGSMSRPGPTGGKSNVRRVGKS